MALIMKNAFTIFCIMCIGSINAQVLKNYAITPAATSYSVDGLSGYWSLGEVENGNRKVGDVLVVQGFSKSNIQAEITSLPDNFTSKITLYPNPVADLLQIDWNNRSSDNALSYSLYNNQGILLKENRLSVVNERSEIDLTGLDSGAYVLRIFSSKSTEPISIRILKTKAE